MTIRQALVMVLVVALLVTAVQPARAEAVEPMTALLIASAGVVVLVLVAYLIIANVDEHRRVSAAPAWAPAAPAAALAAQAVAAQAVAAPLAVALDRGATSESP